MTDFLGHARQNARGPGEDYGGGKELIPGKKLGKFGQGIYWQILSILDSRLARRPSGAAERAARSAELRSSSAQCCLRVASVRALACVEGS